MNKVEGQKTTKRTVIIGGGFGGVRTALDLAKLAIPGMEIVLIANKPHFEYYPLLYRIVTGYSAMQACIPLKFIIGNAAINVVESTVSKVDLKEKVVFAGIDSTYSYDYLVLAVGSETGYFNIPGLPELSYGFKSTSEALKLKAHLSACLTPVADQLPEEKVIAAHFIIVGGGPTGVELAGELMGYAEEVAKAHKSESPVITVDIIEAAPRLLPVMPADISQKVKEQLQRKGVNIFLNRTVIKEEMDELLLKDMTVKTKTVIWTAGVRTNRLIATIEGLEFDKRGRIVVDEHLRAKGQSKVFAVGDVASTQFSGLAQTADKDGAFVAQTIYRLANKVALSRYVPEKPIYALPAGPQWAAVLWGETRIFGRMGYVLRLLADLRYFLSILPLSRALAIFSAHGKISQACSICEEDQAAPRGEVLPTSAP